MARQPGAEDFFAAAAGVGVGSVDDVDPKFGSCVEKRECLIVAETLAPRVGCAPDPADGSATQDHHGDLDAGSAQLTSVDQLTIRQQTPGPRARGWKVALTLIGRTMRTSEPRDRRTHGATATGIGREALRVSAKAVQLANEGIVCSRHTVDVRGRHMKNSAADA
jgi:hypothetical protein